MFPALQILFKISGHISDDGLFISLSGTQISVTSLHLFQKSGKKLPITFSTSFVISRCRRVPFSYFFKYFRSYQTHFFYLSLFPDSLVSFFHPRDEPKLVSLRLVFVCFPFHRQVTSRSSHICCRRFLADM